MTVPLVRCSELPMFEGHPLAVKATLEASQVELTVHRTVGYFDLTRIHFCVQPPPSLSQCLKLRISSKGYPADELHG
jgi:hypothetical protein